MLTDSMKTWGKTYSTWGWICSCRTESDGAGFPAHELQPDIESRGSCPLFLRLSGRNQTMSQRILAVLAFILALGPINPWFAADSLARTSEPLPDLYLDDVRFSQDADTGTTTVDLLVGNKGLALSGRQPVVIQFLSGDDEASASEIYLSLIMNASSGFAERISQTFPNDTLGKVVVVKIDPFGDIVELDENNNQVSAVVALDSADDTVDVSLSVRLEGEGSEILTGSMARFLVSATGLENSIANPVVVFKVRNSFGDIVHITGEMPLLLNDISAEHRTEIYWSTIGLDDGEYTVITSLQSAGKELAVDRQMVSLLSSNANRDPVAEDDRASTSMNQPVDIDVLVNDLEPDGDRLEVYISSSPKYGNVTELRGIASYTPPSGFVGVDSFMYQLDDTRGGSDWATVEVEVLPPEDGCTWVRDFETADSGDRVAVDGWADFNLPEEGAGVYASWVRSNDNPDLFEEQPHISFPSCSLYFEAKPGVTGTAVVTYVVLDKATGGEEYVSEPRTFTIEIKSGTSAHNPDPDNDENNDSGSDSGSDSIVDIFEPQIISTPDTQMQLREVYRYSPQTDSDKPFELYALELPEFLSIENGVVTGMPKDNDVGMHSIHLVLDFGGVSLEQAYLLTVTPNLASSLGNLDSTVSGTLDDSVLEDDDNASANNGVITTGGGALSLWLILFLPLLRRLN